MKTKKHNHPSAIRDTKGDRVFYLVNMVVLLLFTVLCLYPILCIISGAISSAYNVGLGIVTWYPKGFSLSGFKYVLKDSWLINGFGMSVFYTVAGTAINIVITFLTAFALSRRELMGRGFLNLFFAFTMWFSGGVIPSYLLVRNLGLLNTVWALLLPGAMSVWNMIVCRTFLMNSIPEELYEAASIDGAGYVRYMLVIVLPLSKAIVATLLLWYAIAHWNAYFNALIYINDKSLKPLSLYLREYLVQQSSMDISDFAGGEEVASDLLGMTELMKNSLTLLSCLPLWILYPFIQKYLVQGVMVGSVKG
ncbi:carbohydrate ABC transporter permease [Paenibacillus sp.]